MIETESRIYFRLNRRNNWYISVNPRFNGDIALIILVLLIFFFILQIGAVMISALVNQTNHKLFGGLMIGIGVLSLPVSFFLLYMTSALYFATGAHGFRNLEQVKLQKGCSEKSIQEKNETP